MDASVPRVRIKHDCKIISTVTQNLSASRALSSMVPFSGRFSTACREERAFADTPLTTVICTHSFEQARARLGLKLTQYHLRRKVWL